MKINIQNQKLARFIKIFVCLLFVSIGTQLQAQGAGNCLNFDGTNDYVDCGNDVSVNISGSITLEAWVKPSSVSRTNSIIKKYDDNSPFHGYEFYISGSGYPTIRLSNNTATRFSLAATIPAVAGVWIHIAATYDNSTRDMHIYVNGVLAGTLTGTGPTSIASALSTNLTIGAELLAGTGETSKFFLGNIDEVRIWNIALTQNEIQDNMCKKLVSNESNLVGYWRMDETSGTLVNDLTSYNNDGTMINMDPSTEHVASGAAIGDASVSNYSSPTILNLASSYGDDLTIDTFTGTPSGVQIYRIDSAPLITAVSGTNITQLSQSHYFGIFVIGGTNPTYTTTYNYAGHPGITDPSVLDLAKRTNLTSSWTEMNAVLDQGANTLTLTGQSDPSSHIILGTEGANPLPVELSSFTAVPSENYILLNWRTETEVKNYGFEIEKSEVMKENSQWQTIGFVEGNGNSNSPKNYSYTDRDVTAGKYSYRLKQIDTDGRFKYSHTVEINFGADLKLELNQNFPNPFNPATTIQYTIPKSGNVKLTVFNILGEQVAVLVNGYKEAGVYDVQFNAFKLNSGLYLYRLESAGSNQTKKMLLLK